MKPEVNNVPPEVPENHPENEREVEVKPENEPEIDDIFEQIKIETNLEKLQELNKQIQVQKILLLVRFELMTFIFRLVSMILGQNHPKSGKILALKNEKWNQ